MLRYLYEQGGLAYARVTAYQHHLSGAAPRNMENIDVWGNLIWENGSGVAIMSQGDGEFSLNDVGIYNNVLAKIPVPVSIPMSNAAHRSPPTGLRQSTPVQS